MGLAALERAMQEPTRVIVDNAGQEGAVIVGKLLEGDATSNIGYNAAVGGPPPPLPPPPGAPRSAASPGHSARCPDETRVRCPTRQLTRRASYGLETHHFPSAQSYCWK